MYKDKDKQRKAVKEAVQKHRGITQEGITGQGITPLFAGVKAGIKYPAIIIALADPVKKEKLECITQELKNHNVLDEVRYGIGGSTFLTVEKYLSVL